jgi:bifunctional non-homologous end joining protein LigD
VGEERTTVAIGGRQLTLSNLDKVLYPGSGFTKAAVIDYYVRIAPQILTHVAGRPVTFKRYPDGVDAQSFFEKRCPDYKPPWMDTVRLGREGRDKVVAHCDLAEPAALVWAANLAALELHVSLARGPDTTVPTAVVFDLDPGAPADVLTCARVALLLKDVFDRLDLVSCAKTSGSKGLQV